VRSLSGLWIRYLYHSEKTATCYNEFVDSQPLEKFLKGVGGLRGGEPDIPSLKLLFLQAINALEILREEGMVHRDMQPQNMLVRRLPTTSTQPFQLVVMDFCWVRV
jgi:hypothetical protein